MHGKTYVIAGAAASAFVAVVAGPSAEEARASSHREAPLICKDPGADNTDLYAFVSPEPTRQDRVVILWNYIPLEEPSGGPNFHMFDETVRYDFYVDNDGDALPDVGYRFLFTTQRLDADTFLTVKGPVANLADPNYNVRQFYDVYELDKKGRQKKLNASPVPVPPPNVGATSTPNYETNLGAPAVTTLPNGFRVFAGPRDEGFYVDLGAIFDRLTIRNGFGNQGGGKDGTAGYNVHCCAMEIPISELTKDGLPAATTSEPVLGFWTTASRPQTTVLNKKGSKAKTTGKLVQVSRLGMPLVNEVVIPLGMKDRFNASLPKDDAQFLDFVVHPQLGGLLNALYGGAGVDAPTTDRTDLVDVFLRGVAGLTRPANVKPSEQLRLNVSIAPKQPGDAGYSRLGVLGGDTSGFPNGRRVNDDVVDVELRAVAGVLVPGFDKSPNNILGDGVDGNDVPFLTRFPFLAPPQDGLTNSHGK